jgi:hypothetical protein
VARDLTAALRHRARSHDTAFSALLAGLLNWPKPTMEPSDRFPCCEPLPRAAHSRRLQVRAPRPTSFCRKDSPDSPKGRRVEASRRDPNGRGKEIHMRTN